jgi:hypothetical protein
MAEDAGMDDREDLQEEPLSAARQSMEK